MESPHPRRKREGAFFMSRETVKVTDNREPGYFQVDNEVMDDYGLDEIAFYLYSKVCRHAFNNKNCYFSLAKLKKKLKWGNSTVSKALNTLKRKKLVSTERVEGKGYRFFLLPVKKKTLPPTGTVDDNPSPDGKAPSPVGKTTLPPLGNKEDLVKQDSIKKTKKGTGKRPLSIPDDLMVALTDFNQTAGTEFVPDKGLISVWSIAKHNWEGDYLFRAMHNYALSGWHRKKFLAGENCWNLRKFFMNRDGEIPKFYKKNPPPVEGTGYQPIDLTGPVMSEQERKSLMGEDDNEPFSVKEGREADAENYFHDAIMETPEDIVSGD